jgi:hypothetical protein
MPPIWFIKRVKHLHPLGKILLQKVTGVGTTSSVMEDQIMLSFELEDARDKKFLSYFIFIGIRRVMLFHNVHSISQIVFALH